MKKKLTMLLVLLFVWGTLGISVHSLNKVENVMAADVVGTPQLISAKNVSGGVMLTWNSVEDVDGYRVFRRTSGKNWAAVKTLAGAKTSSYTDTAVAGGTLYAYTVRAYKRVDGKLIWGTYNKAGVTVTTSPDAPKLVSAKGYSNNRIALKWEKVKGATGYRIYRKLYGDGKWSVLRTITSSSTVSYIDGTAEMGVKYYYTVRAYTKVGKTNLWGNYDTVGLLANSLIAAPKLTSSSAAADSSVTIKWSHEGNVSGFCVYRKTAGGKWSLLSNRVITKNYTDKSCLPGQTYYYTVRAFVTTSGSSVYSAYNTAGIKATSKIPTPSGTTVTWGGAADSKPTVKVSWKSQENVDGYYIYRRDYDEVAVKWSNWKMIKKCSGWSSDSCIDKDVIWNKAYKYTIRAYKIINGKAVLSSYDTAGTRFTVRIPEVEILSMRPVDKEGFLLKWKAVEGIDGYCIFKRKIAGSGADKELKAYAVIKDEKITSFYEKLSLEIYDTYCYEVRAYVQCGIYKVWGPRNSGGALLKAEKSYKPDYIKDFNVSAESSTSIKVTWDSVEMADEYYIYRRKKGTNYSTRVGTVRNGTEEFEKRMFIDTELEEEQIYYYYITAGAYYGGRWYESSLISEKACRTFRGELKLSSENMVMLLDEPAFSRMRIVMTGTSKMPEKWYSTNTAIATVDSNGTITPRKAGTVNIVAVFEGTEYVCKVTVENPTISKEKVEVKVGESFILRMDNTTQKVSWYSTDYVVKVLIEPINEYEVKITPLEPCDMSISGKIKAGLSETYRQCRVIATGDIEVQNSEIIVNLNESLNVPIRTDYGWLHAYVADEKIVSYEWKAKENGYITLVLHGISVGETEIELVSYTPEVRRTITVKVQEPDPLETSTMVLKNYIGSNGDVTEESQSGNYNVVNSELMYTWTIRYDQMNDLFVYSIKVKAANESAGFGEMLLEIYANVLKSNIADVRCTWLMEAQAKACHLEASIFADIYNKQNVIFNVVEAAGMTSENLEEVKVLANEILKAGFDGWEKLLLNGKVVITINDLGFKAYALG